MKNNEDIERSVIINKLIDTYGFEKYLEIGVNDASNFLKINCKYKECVDPFISFSTDYNINKDIHLLTEDDIIKYRFIEENILTHKMTSDDFFEITDKKYDLIFIDGDHTEEQVTKDIKHALFHLEENGRIVIHDSIPFNEISSLDKRESIIWNGGVYRSILKLNTLYNGIRYNTINEDYGVCVISKMKSFKIKSENFNDDIKYYDIFSKECISNAALNIISFDEFEELLANKEI